MSIKHKLCAALTLLWPALTMATFWTPHAGIDAKFWGVRNKTPAFFYGNVPFDNEKIFPRIEDGFSVYLGSRVNGYFGFDIGYEQSVIKEKSYQYNGGEIVFVEPELVGNATEVDIRLRAIYLDFTFYWEVLRRFEVLFIMGTTFVTPQTHIFHLLNDPGDPASGAWLEYRNESDRKWMGRFGLGVQYNILPCLGLKATLMWEPTNRIDYVGFDEHDLFFDVHPYTHATMVNLGLVYSLGNPRRHVPIDDNGGWSLESL